MASSASPANQCTKAGTAAKGEDTLAPEFLLRRLAKRIRTCAARMKKPPLKGYDPQRYDRLLQRYHALCLTRNYLLEQQRHIAAASSAASAAAELLWPSSLVKRKQTACADTAAKRKRKRKAGAKTEVNTEANTEVNTEANTEVNTEVNTEANTEAAADGGKCTNFQKCLALSSPVE